MGRLSKNDKWLAADPIRIKTFWREFTFKLLKIPLGRDAKIKDIQFAISSRAHSLDVSDTTLRAWKAAEDFPLNTCVTLIEKEWPGCADWLTPDIDSSPIRRFLCALDIWGSPIDSPARKLNSAVKKVTVGNGLSILSKRWGPVLKRGSQFKYVIPRIKRYVPPQVAVSVYDASNPLSLMNFMFLCGPYIELSDEEFTEWAIDFASLTLIVGAFYDGISFAERGLHGAAYEYSFIVHYIFFLPHDNWPNVESVKSRLEIFSNLDDSAIDFYSQRLMRALGVLNKELFAIGSDISIVKKLQFNIKDPNRRLQEPLDEDSETFDYSDLIQVKRNLSPAAPDRYRYELRHLSCGTRIALCHDLKLGAQSPLLKRTDLFKGTDGLISWGYSGAGPKLLAFSIIAHHLGHDDFDFEEVNRLLDAYISRLPGQFIETSFFLTTELIDKCLNE